MTSAACQAPTCSKSFNESVCQPCHAVECHSQGHVLLMSCTSTSIGSFTWYALQVLSSVEAAATAESLTAKAVEQLQATASGSTVPAVNGYKGEDEAGYIALWGERLRPEV
jgi:hypothetical protein